MVNILFLFTFTIGRRIECINSQIIIQIFLLFLYENERGKYEKLFFDCRVVYGETMNAKIIPPQKKRMAKKES